MLFSIITVNYNNAIGLKKTIESVFAQTSEDFEYIVVDGGSTDESLVLLQSNNTKIDYWVSEKDRGVYDAMNKGWRASKGKYCLFLNSGDYFYNENVLRTVSSKIKITAQFVYGLLIWEDSGYMWNPLKDFKLHEILDHTPIPHQASFISRELLIKLRGYKSEYRIISDWGFIVDALRNNVTFQKIEEYISYAETPGLSSISENYIIKERRSYLFKYHLFAYLYSTIKNLIKRIIRN